MFPAKRGKSLGAASNDKDVADMMNKVLKDGIMTIEEKFDWLCMTVTDQQELIEKRDLQLITLNRETETLQLKVVDLNDQIAIYRQQVELQEQELSKSDILKKEMARQDLVKEGFIKSAESSNKRLAEENASLSELIGCSAKRARILENVAEYQEEEIGDLQAQVVLSESNLVAYEEEIMLCREERRQWEIEAGSGSLEEENQRLKNRLSRAIEMADEAESRVLVTRKSTGLQKAKTRVLYTREGKTKGTETQEQRQETPVQEPSKSSYDESGLPPVDIDTTLADEEPAEELTADEDDSDESVESDADEDEGPRLQFQGAICRAQEAPKSQPQPQGGPTRGMQFASPKYQPWNMPGLRSDKDTHGLQLQGTLYSSSSSPNYTPEYTRIEPQMDIGPRPLPSQMSPDTLAIQQSFPSDRVVPGPLGKVYGPGVQVSPFSWIPFGGSFSGQSAFPSTNDSLSTLQSDLLSSLDEVEQKVEQKALEEDKGQESGESDNDEQSIVGSVTGSKQMSIAYESSSIEYSLNKRRRMNDESASLLSVLPRSETPPPEEPETRDEHMEDDADANGQGSLFLTPAANIPPIQQISSAQDLPERQDEETMLEAGAGDGKDEDMKDLGHSNNRSTSEERPSMPKGWDKSYHTSPKFSPSSHFSGRSSAVSDSFEYEDEIIRARHRMYEMIRDSMRAEELSQRLSNVHLVDTSHGPVSMTPTSQKLEKKRKRQKLSDDVSESEGEKEVTSAIQALPVDEPETERFAQEPSPPVKTAESGTQTEVEWYQEAWCQTEEHLIISNGTQTVENPAASNGTQTESLMISNGIRTEEHPTTSTGTQTQEYPRVSNEVQTEEYLMASNGTQTEVHLMVSNGVQTEEYPAVSYGMQTEEHHLVSRGTQTRRRRRRPGKHAFTQTQSWHASESGTQTKVVEVVAASAQTDVVSTVNAGTQAIVLPSGSSTRDAKAQTEASSHTDIVPMVNADTETIPLPAGFSTRDADTQVEEPCVEVVVVKEVRSNSHSNGLLQWLSTGLVIMLLVCLWMSGRERRMWLQANDVSRQTLVDIRDGAPMRFQWLQMLDFEIARWLKIDLVGLG
ncbi:hypothetical protein VTN00DRAFT_6119 [Thermoascus crustaceus]|uniref:uncharacterized protein n=1 Tax=Thermoascus crustaceus TaxID=5088 RepID=UPI00374354C3